MDSNLTKANRLSALYARVVDIDSAIHRLDETAKLLLENNVSISLDMVITKGTMEIVQEEFNIPPVFVPGYPPITSIMLPKHTNTAMERIFLPEAITLSIIGTIVAHYNVERRLIVEEIDTILNPNARPKSKTKAVPIGRV